MENVMQIKKVITVQGVKNSNGTLKQFVFGPDAPENIPDDDTCLAAVEEVVPTISGVNNIQWATTYENGVQVMKGQITPRSQTKGC